MKARRCPALLLALASALLVGCTAPTAPHPTPAGPPTPIRIVPAAQGTPAILPPLGEITVLARVNGEPIDAETFGKELLRTARLLTDRYGQRIGWYSARSQEQLPALRESVLEQLIDQELLRQLAQAEGFIIPTDQVEAAAAQAREEIVKTYGYSTWEEFLDAFLMTEEEFSRSVHANLLYRAMVVSHAGPTTVDQVHVQQIVTHSEEEAQDALERLNGGHEFAAVAQEVSVALVDHPDDLGRPLWLPRGILPQALEDLAFSLPVGATGGPLQVESSFHIVRVLAHEPHPLEANVKDAYQTARFGAWFGQQKAQAQIERYVTFVPATPSP
ncbi:MAG: peptidylprolyl isomerase [Chloroflexi bacterium]|nr:peptidylprolyl isomerase [Chloroflexota bacterium]